jgi:uncharacterized SAM-binding protein YcdF (DUF218 family)
MRKRILRGLFVISVVLVIGALLRWWSLEMQKVTQYPVSAWTETQQADCAIVLTGEKSRLGEGFDLLYRNHVKKLIISGVNPTSHLEEIFPNIIFYGKIEPENIILEKNSKTTYGNAQQTLPLAEALKCHDVILVTSRLHMYRALKTFQTTYPADMAIYPRGTVGRKYYYSYDQLAMESLKSLFYSLWVY